MAEHQRGAFAPLFQAAAGIPRRSPMSSAAPDHGLISRIAAGDEEALAVLYRKYGRVVFSLAFQVTADRSASEEITQDVFSRVWRNAGRYKPETAAVETWIMSITRNRAIDEIRRRKVRIDPLPLDLDGHGGATLADERENPEDRAAAEEKRARVRAALSSLPEEQREAISMAFLRGLTHSRIARELGQPVGTIKTRIRLGMRKLRDVLSDDDSTVIYGTEDA